MGGVTGPLQTWTSSTYHDSAFTNYAVAFHPANVGQLDWVGSPGDFWCHLHWIMNGWTSGTEAPITFSAGASLEYRVFYTPGASNATLNLQKTTNGSTWTTLCSWTMASSGDLLTYLDIHIKAHATLGTADVYMNGSSVATFAGNTLAQTSTVNRATFTSASSGTYLMLSEMVIADVPTIGWRVQTVLPNSSGTYSEWTGSYLDVDESIPDDNDFVISNTTGQRELFNVSDPTTATLGSREFKALVVNSRGAISADSAPTDMQHMLRSNSADYLTANLGHVNDAAIRLKTTIYELNPSTSAKFTLAEAAAVQIGVKAV